MFRNYIRRTRFHRQLTLVVSTGILILALFSSLIHSYKASQHIRAYMLEQGLRITENMSRQSTLALMYQAADNARLSINATLSFPDVIHVEITDASSKLLVSQSKADVSSLAAARPKTALPSTPITHAILEGETPSQWFFAAPVYTDRTIGSPFEAEEYKPQLLGYVYITLSKKTLHRLIYSLLLDNILITFSFALFLLIVMRRLAQQLIVPLNTLSDLMLQAESGRSGIRAIPEGPKDIIEMAHAFNKMMEVLEERETELKKSRDEALHLAHMKAMFASMVSHEIRTPLNGVIGMLDILKEMSLNKNQYKCLDIAIKSSHSLLELINNILDFSKMEAGKLELEHIDFNIESSINEVITLLSLQAQQKNLALEYIREMDVPLFINADPLRLRQVLTNLIGNALKFTEQGKILVHVSVAQRISTGIDADTLILKTSHTPEAGQPAVPATIAKTPEFILRFEVQDTGVGMSEEAAQRIFESFAQADSSTTRKHGGTGLGLAISKQIVELMGGHIGVTSQLGQGTTFWFTFPCVAATAQVAALHTAELSLPQSVTEAPASPASTFSMRSSREYTILVVEDNQTNQMVAGSMLELSNCLHEFASNGLEAVEAIGKQRYDLIFMDCNMPEMDGYAATTQIRRIQEAAGYYTPIVAMTANTHAGDVEKCYTAGMDDYLSKPITLDRLQNKLDQWLKGAPVAELSQDAPVIHTNCVPLDHLIFGKLREILGTGLQQTITIFIEDTDTYLSKLNEAIHASDNETIQSLAHTIKGSSSNLGAVEMAHIAKEIEKHAQTADFDALPPLAMRLKQAFDTVSRLFKHEVEEPAPVSTSEERVPQILVVDDDRSIRSTLRYMLQNEGFQVEEAVNGSNALTLLKRLKPQLIIMDALMPVMDGFEACARIQELFQGMIPVLIITASEDPTLVDRALAVGAVDYIPKPINFPALAKRVRRIIAAYQFEAKAQYFALKDPLTDLPNRTHFLEILERSTQQSEICALLFIDLYRFKRVNDSFGTAIGDRLLLAIAQRVKHRIRATDCVARLGGDEFAILLTNLDSTDRVGNITQNICRALASPFRIEQHSIFITASVGIAVYPTDTLEPAALLKYAETAMYRSRKDSCPFQFFKPEMEQALAKDMRLENDLRSVVFDEQFKLVYQPQADLSDNRIIGMEALIRWHHPEHGMVSPLQFIPIAEETGLIHAIGEWVLRTACRQLQQWRQEGLPEIRVGVNVSVRQLVSKDFSLIVERVLTETQLPPHLLDLEITESGVMENTEDTLRVLHQLRNLGVRLSIDDFGTGYSSLSYLKRFPVNTIKIDRSFIKELPQNSDDQALVTGIIVLAHSLRLEVIAEGVETAEQLAFLHEQQCDLMQGYYLSKPIPPEEFRLLLTR